MLRNQGSGWGHVCGDVVVLDSTRKYMLVAEDKMAAKSIQSQTNRLLGV